MWWPEPAAWSEFEELVERTQQSGQSLDWFDKHLRTLAERHGWGDALPLEDRRRFRAFALGIYRRHYSIEYARHRLVQLRAGKFSHWIYSLGPRRTCAGAHAAFDGIVLPPAHSFWRNFFPPNGPECDCHVSGVRGEAGAVRLGGDPGKHLPMDWMDNIPPMGWRGTRWLDLRGIFAEALRDLAQ